MSLKLPMDFAKDCILMVRITEDGSFILVEFRLQCTDEIKVRKVSGRGIDELSGVSYFICTITSDALNLHHGFITC